MSSTHTVCCRKCGSTSTGKIGVSKSGSGVFSCRNCHKPIRVHLNGKGEIVKVT